MRLITDKSCQFPTYYKGRPEAADLLRIGFPMESFKTGARPKILASLFIPRGIISMPFDSVLLSCSSGDLGHRFGIRTEAFRHRVK